MRPQKIRAVPFGPLPKDVGHYQGMYRNGDQVVFAYTVGPRLVRETPAFTKMNGLPAFTRTLEVTAGDQPISVLACDEDAAHPVAFAMSEGVSKETDRQSPLLRAAGRS